MLDSTEVQQKSLATNNNAEIIRPPGKHLIMTKILGLSNEKYNDYKVLYLI